MKISINITKEVLQISMWCSTENQPGDANENCAFAHAVRCLLPDAKVWRDRIVFGDNASTFDPPYTFIRLPEEAIKFITDFDKLNDFPHKRLDLPESSFIVNIPDSVIDKIGIEEAKAIIEKSSTLELVN